MMPMKRTVDIDLQILVDDLDICSRRLASDIDFSVASFLNLHEAGNLLYMGLAVEDNHIPVEVALFVPLEGDHASWVALALYLVEDIHLVMVLDMSGNAVVDHNHLATCHYHLDHLGRLDISAVELVGLYPCSWFANSLSVTFPEVDWGNAAEDCTN